MIKEELETWNSILYFDSPAQISIYFLGDANDLESSQTV